MCYVSAEGRSRDATVDEVLIVERQSYGSNWLVSPNEPSVAVCLRAGTKVELLYIPERTQQQFGVPREAEATFKMNDWWRRDVFVLPNGRKVELRKLQPGQVVRVLSLPGTRNQTDLAPEIERTELVTEGANTRHQTARRNPTGVPVHWCL